MTSCATPGPKNFLAVSPVQNSAPVLDFRCLFTRDIVRKQKRWQDGRLKFHTFNKRIIVHDERSNFVGDSHWQEDGALEDGTELSLERNGVLVQVGEYLGKREQNLDELLEKRIREREKRAAAKIASGTPKRFSVPSQPSGFSHFRSKALNTMLASSKNFEKLTLHKKPQSKERQGLSPALQRLNEQDHLPKRRKLDLSNSERIDSNRKNIEKNGAQSSFQHSSEVKIGFELGMIKPTLEHSSHATIDLTIDDENDGIQSQLKEKDVSNTYTTTAKVRGKTHLMYPNKPSTGYANQLTGASLTLTAPHQKYSSRLDKSSKKSVTAPSIQISECDNLATWADDVPNSATFEAENPAKIPVPAHTHTYPGPKINELSNFSTRITGKRPKSARIKSTQNFAEVLMQTTNISQIQSPSPGISRIQSLSPDISHIQSLSPDISTTRYASSTTKSTSSRTKSTLRIKSRPPRRMLSLGISSPHVSGEIHHLVRKKISSNLSRNLDDHSNQLESAPMKEIISSVSSSSSIVNSEIETTHDEDEALPRELATSPLTTQINSQKKHTLRSAESPHHRQKVPIKENVMTSYEILNNLAEPEINEKYLKVRSRKSPSGKVSPISPNIVDSPLDQSPLGESQVFEQEATHHPAYFFGKNTLSNNFIRKSRLEGENKSSRTVSNIKTVQKEQELSQSDANHPSRGIQSATDRFKTIINILGKNKKKIEVKGPTLSGRLKKFGSKIDRSNTPSDDDDDDKNNDNDNSVISETGNISPSPSPIVIPSSQKLYDADIVGSQKSITTALDSPPKKARSRKSNVILPNPATRGISLHTIAASTKAALNQKTSIEPSSISPRSETLESFPEDNDPFESASSSFETKTPATGPWSRESFDLLGDMKIPGR